MRVLLCGLELFGNRLAKQLNQHFPDSKFYYCNTYYSTIGKIQFLVLLPFVDMVISLNGVTDYSKSMNWVFKFKKKLLFVWQGTDALLALQRNKNGTICRKYIDNAYHFVDSPWLESEVKSLRLHPKRVMFKPILVNTPMLKHETITVTTYISQTRKEFYGYNRVVELARAFPDYTFNVFGMHSVSKSYPLNINFWGWSSHEAFLSQLKKTSIFLRLVEHDGLSVSLLEALSYGCEVLSTMPFECCHHTLNSKSDIKTFSRVVEMIRNRQYATNTNNIEWVRKNLEPNFVLHTFYNELKLILHA